MATVTIIERPKKKKRKGKNLFKYIKRFPIEIFEAFIHQNAPFHLIASMNQALSDRVPANIRAMGPVLRALPANDSAITLEGSANCLRAIPTNISGLSTSADKLKLVGILKVSRRFWELGKYLATAPQIDAEPESHRIAKKEH